jgi:hypothetical protein
MKKLKKGKKRSTLARKAKIKRLSPGPLSFPWAPPFGPAPDIGAGDSLGDPLSDPLAAATAALRAGRPEEAFSLCERVLAAEPDNADALNLAGVTPPTWPR